jgi:hypothetical protein
VITNADLEHWFNGHSDERIDSSSINSVGFVHCVGSRDEKAGNTQCSKVCCITAIKQAMEIKEMYPNSQVYCFYMDLRLFGKKYEDFYTKAQRDYGIHFIRGRVSEVGENIEGKVGKGRRYTVGKTYKVNSRSVGADVGDGMLQGFFCGIFIGAFNGFRQISQKQRQYPAHNIFTKERGILCRSLHRTKDCT